MDTVQKHIYSNYNLRQSSVYNFTLEATCYVETSINIYETGVSNPRRS
jgi:hypothetical protein